MSSLTDLPYFHGNVDEQTSKEILIDAGDFIVRNAENKQGSPHSYCVLVVAVAGKQTSTTDQPSEKDTCTNRLQSFSIHVPSIMAEVGRLPSDGPFNIQGDSRKFITVAALCDFLVTSNTCLYGGVVLKKGVDRKPWQLMEKSIEYPSPEILLGQGAYGKVLKGKLRKDGRSVAIKRSTEKGLADIYSEARAMRRLIHPNIIRLEGVVVDQLPVQLAIQFMEGSSLLSALEEKKVPNKMKFSVVVGIMYGLLYMHTKNYIHRDIAARNVMVSKDCLSVKIIDFGLAKHGLSYTVHRSEKIATSWLAPEVFRTYTFTAKSDIWAFGVTIWEIYHDGAAPTVPAITPNKKSDHTAKRKRSRSISPNSRTEANHLVITENLQFLPKLFEPMVKAIFLCKRDRIELAYMANEIEKKVMLDLPEEIAAGAVRYHIERRPKFDPNFRCDENQAAAVKNKTNKRQKTGHNWKTV